MEFDHLVLLKLGQHARDRLDGQAQEVGDVLARHRQVYPAAAQPFGHLVQKTGDPLQGALAGDQHHVLLGAG